jgi:Sensors of blue-light using FAD
MRQLLYISSAVRGTAVDMAAIVGQSIRNNRRVGVTGLLWGDGKRFLQVLEGEDAAVQTTFDRIAADPRHRGIVVLHDRTIAAREFGEWSMVARGPLDSADALDARMQVVLAGASPAVRGTFEGLIAARRAA